MRTKRNYIMSLLLAVATLAGFTACTSDDPHEGENGVTIALDNSRCPNVAVGQTYIYMTQAATSAPHTTMPTPVPLRLPSCH